MGFLYFYQGRVAPGDGTGTNFISKFNPFGGSATTPPASTPPPVDVSGYIPPSGVEASVAKLIKVSSMPVAGLGVFSKERYVEVPPVQTEGEVVAPKKQTPPKTEFAPAVRYVAKTTGHIYQTFADKIQEVKFSGTVVPKVHDAYFGNKGESVVMRYLKADEKTIESFVGTLPKEVVGKETSTENEIKSSFLPNNVTDLSIAPDDLKIFYLFNLSDSVVGTTLTFLNGSKVQIFDSPFTEWLSGWPNSNLITLTTKPSFGVPGYMYTMNSAGKNLIKALGDINGLTTLTSPDGKLVLFANDNLSLSIYNISTRSVSALGVRSLPEKCVWGRESKSIYCFVPKLVPTGRYPDSWYQGEVSFSDQLWKIDAVSGNTTLLLDPTSVPEGENIDGIKPATDAGEKYLFFVNKKDSFLWRLDLR